jgi:predicted transcriptional regulator
MAIVRYILQGALLVVATTTIQLSTGVKRTLERMKLHPRETFNDVVERVLEDLRELDDATKAEVEQARVEIRSGRYLTSEQVRKAMGF